MESHAPHGSPTEPWDSQRLSIRDELDRRLSAAIAAKAARKTARAEQRRQFAQSRNIGLRQRHADKLSKNFPVT